MGASRQWERSRQGQQQSPSSATLLSGNSQSRFSLQGAVLVHSDKGPPLPEQPHTHELLIRVADAGPSVPHLSTTATVIVHLVPWRASTVATSTHRATVRGGPWALEVGGERISEDGETQFSRWTVGEGTPEGTVECREQYRRANLGCRGASRWRGLDGQGTLAEQW